MKEKIIQIIPAPANLYAIYAVDGGEGISEVVCLALTDSGKVLAMDVFGREIDFCDGEHTTFKGFRKMLPQKGCQR